MEGKLEQVLAQREGEREEHSLAREGHSYPGDSSSTQTVLPRAKAAEGTNKQTNNKPHITKETPKPPPQLLCPSEHSSSRANQRGPGCRHSPIQEERGIPALPELQTTLTQQAFSHFPTKVLPWLPAASWVLGFYVTSPHGHSPRALLGMSVCAMYEHLLYIYRPKCIKIPSL